jgi:hypothetical protein
MYNSDIARCDDWRRIEMSWDVFLMKFPEGFDGGLENLPHDFEPEAICAREYFETEIKRLIPKINYETRR